MAQITEATYFMSPSIHTLSTALSIPAPPSTTPPTLYLTTRHNPITRTPILNITCSNTSTKAFHSASYFSDSSNNTEGVEIRWRYASEEGGYMTAEGVEDGLVTRIGEECFWISRRVVLDGGMYDLEGLKRNQREELVGSNGGDLWVTVGIQGI